MDYMYLMVFIDIKTKKSYIYNILRVFILYLLCHKTPIVNI